MVGPVYHIICDDCGATYVSKTERSLKTRFLEHWRKSMWVVRYHILYTWIGQNIKILTVETRKFEREVNEAIYIREVQLSPNKDGNCYLLPAV